MTDRECPVPDGCHGMHPWHGQEECQVDIGNGAVDPQTAEQCPCVGACDNCHGYGAVAYDERDYKCGFCAGTGRSE